MIKHVIWDLGDTIITSPTEGMDLHPLHEYSELTLRPLVHETLQKLRNLGYIQAILSNTATSDSNSVRIMLNQLGVLDCFSFVYATQSELNDNRPQKPNPMVFNIVLNALGVSPQHAVMVGNNWDTDILGANHIGMNAVWLQNKSVSVRKDTTTSVKIPPWIIPVRDVTHVLQGIKFMEIMTCG